MKRLIGPELGIGTGATIIGRMESTSVDQSPGASHVLREVDTLLAELSQLADTQIAPRAFYAQVLERAVFILSAEGAAVWRLGDTRELQLAYHQGLASLQDGGGQREQARLQPLVANPRAELVPRTPETECNHWVAVAPIVPDNQPWGLLAIYFTDELPPAVREGFLRFAVELARITAIYQQRREQAAWRTQRAEWKGYAEYALAVHRRWSLADVASEVANSGRQYLGCDRLAVAVVSRRRCKLLAVSGLDAVHQHANLVRKLEHLVEAVLAQGQPFFYDDQTSDLPPQIETPLKSYLEESGTRSLAILPCYHPDPTPQSVPWGATICEQFRSHNCADLEQRLPALQQHASLALSRAVRLKNVPLLSRLAERADAYAWLKLSMWPVWGLALAACSLLLAALVFIPADFDIKVRGQFVPQLQRHVFASQDGIAEKVHVTHDQAVQSGELLIELSSTALDLEFQRISGEMGVARTELMAIRTEQLQAPEFDARQAEKLQQLSARELALSEQLKNLTAQLELLTQERDALRLYSPIDGRVLSWDVRTKLLARPVRRGNILLTIADTAGPWVARLHVPDESAGHILSAQAQQTAGLSVSFVSVSDPGVTCQGTLQQIENSSQLDPVSQVNGVQLDVTFDKSQLAELRPGAAVVGKVHCGRRALGYVWLHEFWEELDRRFF